MTIIPSNKSSCLIWLSENRNQLKVKGEFITYIISMNESLLNSKYHINSTPFTPAYCLTPWYYISSRHDDNVWIIMLSVRLRSKMCLWRNTQSHTLGTWHRWLRAIPRGCFTTSTSMDPICLTRHLLLLLRRLQHRRVDDTTFTFLFLILIYKL